MGFPRRGNEYLKESHLPERLFQYWQEVGTQYKEDKEAYKMCVVKSAIYNGQLKFHTMGPPEKTGIYLRAIFFEVQGRKYLYTLSLHSSVECPSGDHLIPRHLWYVRAE